MTFLGKTSEAIDSLQTSFRFDPTKKEFFLREFKHLKELLQHFIAQ
jgi:hypothetical protein